MKLPEYSLKKDYNVNNNSNQQDPIVFPAGTLCMPFWSEHNLPPHVREDLYDQIAPKGSKFIMCLIGRFWVPVLQEHIRQN